MTDYKRMVSYMYQYENGVKRKNVGFARVEAKGGLCKITLHMQLLGQLDSIFPTYLIQREDNNTQLIYLGDTILKNQIMDSRLSTEEYNVMGSGHALSEMGGLLLFLNDSVFFATEWDDKPIIAEEVLEALRPKKNTPEVTSVPEEPPYIFQETNAAQAKEEPEIEEVTLRSPAAFQSEEEPGMYEEEPEIESENIAESKDTAESKDIIESKDFAEDNITSEGSPGLSLEEEMKIPRYKLPGGWKMVERLQNPYAFRPSPSAEPEKEMNHLEFAKNEEQSVDLHDTIPEEEQNRFPELNPEELNPDSQEVIQNVDGMEEGRIIDGSSCLDGENDVPDHPTANRFFDNYPRIYPFEDNEIILCVKIEPKDIGLLPKELWPLSSNSFLMHGFYCYHHLIFAKMKNRFGCRYIIGIPGIYHSREQFMARMFGFESFKSIRKRELKQGDFGYWYLPVYF